MRKLILPLALALTLPGCATLTDTPTAPLAQTHIDEQALTAAYASFDVLLTAIDGLVVAGVLVPGTDKALGLNGSLLRNFDRALEPDIAARILVLGMETGAFTGKGLRKYLSGEVGTFEQFKAARRIINGTDKDALIAGHAEKFQAALLAGKWED